MTPMYDSRTVPRALPSWRRSTAALAGPSPASTDGERIDRIRHFEELKAAIAAAQARETAAFAASQRADQIRDGVRAERADRGIPEQVALARRCSPFQARRYLGWARILTTELPATLAALTGRGDDRVAGHDRRAGDGVAVPRPPRPASTANSRRGSRNSATGGWRPKPPPSPTGSTPKAPPSAAATRRRTAGSACGPRRTR